MVIINKREKSCQIIDVAIPEDGRVREMKYEKDPTGEKFENCRVFLGFTRLLLLPGARENTRLIIISRTKIQY